MRVRPGLQANPPSLDGRRFQDSGFDAEGDAVLEELTVRAWTGLYEPAHPIRLRRVGQFRPKSASEREWNCYLDSRGTDEIPRPTAPARWPDLETRELQ